MAALLWFFLSAVLARAQTQDALVQGAERRKVVYWTTMRVADAQALADAFESRYPFLKVEVVRDQRGPVDRARDRRKPGRHYHCRCAGCIFIQDSYGPAA